MSLRVWLPLNGSLENKGLDDITPVLTGAVAVDNEGKIGKCYKFGTSLGRITIPPAIMRNYTECSISFWVNILGWQTNWDTFFQAGLGTSPWNSYTFGVLRNQSNHVVFAISDGSTSSQGNYKSSDLALNTWYHLGFIYKSGHCCIYVNGNLYKDYSTNIIPNFSGINYISLGQLGNVSSYQTNCKMNDFRIYDHALSPLEVKHIAQGLILHYPLNRGGWGQENLITGYDTSFLRYPDGAVTLFSNQMNGGAQEIVSNIGGAIKCLHLHNNGSNGRQYGMLSVTSGKSYTISCDYYSTSSQAFPFRGELNGGNYSWAGSNAAAYTTPNKWVRLSFSYLNLTSDATIYYFMQCSQNTDCYIKNLKIEEGPVATPWCPNSSDALATTMGLNDNIEYDTSGYENNGTRMGTFSWTSNTPKYTVSQVFNGTDNAIQTPSLPSMISDKNYTIAVWIYKTVIGSKGYQTIYGGPSGFEIEARNGGANETKFVPWNWGKPMASYELNEWNHCVFVHSDSDCKIYLNGEYVATGTAKASNPSGNYFVGAWSTATQQNFEGKMSDFRIYATALSADDIKDLYELGAAIDNNNTLYTYELNEV